MFCDSCGNILRPKEGLLYCDTCENFPNKKINLTSEINKKKKILEEVDKTELNPTVEKRCRHCGNNKAFFTLKQTRSGDEPPTKFFKCTKCSKAWRDYN